MAMPGIRLLHVELCNVCNFACDFCPQTLSARKPCRLPLSVFKDVVNQVVDNGWSPQIMLHVLGEPLLHPDVLDAVRYVAERGLKPILTTNGSLLNETVIKGLNDSGLYSMDISLQLLGQERHEARRSGLSFDAYYRRVLQSVRAIRETASFQLIVKVMNTTYRRLFAFDRPLAFTQEGREFRALVQQLVLDIYGALGERVEAQEVAEKLRRANLRSALRIRLAEKLFVFVQLFMDWGNAFCERTVYPARFGSCSFAFTAPAVLSDGSVVMCCADYDGRTRLGHVDEAPLASILRSERAEWLWDGFKKHRLRHPHCQRCLGSTGRLRAWAKGLGSILVSRFMNFEGENRLVLR